MIVPVHQPDIIIGRDIDAVRVGGKGAFAPRRDEVAVGVPDGQGMRAPAEDIDLVLRVDRAVGRRAELPILGHVGPFGDALILIVARAYGCHVLSPVRFQVGVELDFGLCQAVLGRELGGNARFRFVVCDCMCGKGISQMVILLTRHPLKIYLLVGDRYNVISDRKILREGFTYARRLRLDKCPK